MADNGKHARDSKPVKSYFPTEKVFPIVGVVAAILITIAAINLLTSEKQKSYTDPNSPPPPSGHEQVVEKSADVKQAVVKKSQSATPNVIEMEPGDNFMMEIKCTEWGPWIDASKSGIHVNVKLRTDRIYQFENLKTLRVKKGEQVRLPSDIYRMRTVKGNHMARIKAAMHPINEDLY